jgi:hypothetical protein
MITPYENGTSVNIQGLICNIPPAGYVFNFLPKNLNIGEFISVPLKKKNNIGKE